MWIKCVYCSPDLVHAPRRLTMLRWGPRWVMIFSSDIRACFSLERAVAEKREQRPWLSTHISKPPGEVETSVFICIAHFIRCYAVLFCLHYCSFLTNSLLSNGYYIFSLMRTMEFLSAVFKIHIFFFKLPSNSCLTKSLTNWPHRYAKLAITVFFYHLEIHRQSWIIDFYMFILNRYKIYSNPLVGM